MKGLIIRNGLVQNSSWSKRVNHWKDSFQFHNIDTEIYSVYPLNQTIENQSSTINFLLKYFSHNYFLYFLSPIIILKKLLKLNPDFILLANGGFWEFFTIPIYCKLRGIPLLVDMVDTIGRKHKPNKSLIDYLIILNKVLFDYFVVKNAYEIFVISSVLEKEYQSRFPNKKVTRSIPSTVDLQSFELNSQIELKEFQSDHYLVFNRNEFIKIFYAGTITRLNGVEFFLDCLSEIQNNENISVLVIFAIIEGDEAKLLKVLENYKETITFEIVPPIYQDKLPSLLCRANILFIPEQGYETANAGFPGKTAEYLMSGVPVITTDFSDLPYYLTDGINACITKMGDHQSYQKNLVKLLTDPKFRDFIGTNGRKVATSQFNHLISAVPYINTLKEFYHC